MRVVVSGLTHTSTRLVNARLFAKVYKEKLDAFAVFSNFIFFCTISDSNKKAKLIPARAMLLYVMFHYEVLGENASLFVANKLAYFLQRLGEQSFNKIEFKRGHYGPYSVQVEYLLHNLNGKYLKGLEQMNAKAFEPLEMQYDKLAETKTNSTKKDTR